ncbi:unnamed protein product [Closterium sp. NIES-64]|nr:unnamed protein product [Closterium sp. NIES-64]
MPNVDAGGTARGDPNPSDDQATPSPASPEIAEENVARGIALAVSAGLPDHEGMGGEGSEDVQENAYPPPRADSARDAQEKGGEERAAVEGAAEASTRAPAAADRPGGSTQHEQAPTNTLARRGARQDDGEAFEPARSGARARSRRGAQGDADEARQAQAAVASSPRNPPAPDPVSRMGPSPPILPQPTPVRRRSENETAAAPQTGREGAAVGRATQGIRVGRGSRRGRRGNERGRRGGGARGSNRRRSGASGYARNVERLMRNGAEGDVEPLSEKAEEEAENEESEEGDPAFNPESEGMLEAEAEEDEEELELLREAELPNQQARELFKGRPSPLLLIISAVPLPFSSLFRTEFISDTGASDTGANGDSSDSAKVTQDPRDPGPKLLGKFRVAPHTASCKFATTSLASARFNIRHMRDQEQDPAGGQMSRALRHSAGPAAQRNHPNSDAEGTARGDPIPSDAQATPSPASPELAAVIVERGIALGVSAGLLDHGGTGAEESEDAQGSADPPSCADNARDAREKGDEETAAVGGDAEASARAPAAADRLDGSTQHAPEPTNTQGRRGARLADGEVSAPARSGGRARLRRDAQEDAVEARQVQAPAARSPRNAQAPDPVLRTGPSLPTVAQQMPARRRGEDETTAAPQAGREGVAVARATRGIRVGRGSRRGRRGSERGWRGGGARGTNRRRTGASGFARNAERLIRQSARGGEEELREETEEAAENEGSDEGDPLFNPEREGLLGAEVEEDEEELDRLLQGEEVPSPRARGDPANRTTSEARDFSGEVGRAAG